MTAQGGPFTGQPIPNCETFCFTARGWCGHYQWGQWVPSGKTKDIVEARNQPIRSGADRTTNGTIGQP